MHSLCRPFTQKNGDLKCWRSRANNDEVRQPRGSPVSFVVEVATERVLVLHDLDRRFANNMRSDLKSKSD